MTWFDVVAFLLVGAIAWLESNRGFGRALFDTIGAIVSVRIAISLAKPLGGAVALSQTAAVNEAIWLWVTFALLMALVVIASRFLYETTLLSLDVLDPLVGALLGVISGLILAHIFLRGMLAIYGGSEAADLLLNSFAGQELLRFRSFHTVVSTLQHLGED